MIGFYYLHANGDLIYKKFRPDPSDFVRRIWQVDFTERGSCWILLIEAKAMGAREVRIQELVKKWGTDDEDAQKFIRHATDKNGKKMFCLFRYGNEWCAAFHDFTDIQSIQCGFGVTALEALSELAKPGLT